MFTIIYEGQEYSPTNLVPLNLKDACHGPVTVTFKFWCTSKCQVQRPLRLGVGYFTRNVPQEAGEEVYGVHQGHCDFFFPIEIQ